MTIDWRTLELPHEPDRSHPLINEAISSLRLSKITSAATGPTDIAFVDINTDSGIIYRFFRNGMVDLGQINVPSPGVTTNTDRATSGPVIATILKDLLHKLASEISDSSAETYNDASRAAFRGHTAQYARQYLGALESDVATALYRLAAQLGGDGS